MNGYSVLALLRRRIVIGLLFVATLTATADGPKSPEIPPPPPESPNSINAAPVFDHEPPPAPHRFSPEEFVPLLGVAIPIVAIVMTLGVGGLAIWMEYRKRRDLLNACHIERMAAIEKGLEIPPFPGDFQSGSNRGSGRRSTGLKPGLVLLGIGIGGVFTPGRVGAPIVVCMGAAFLVYYAIEGRKLKPVPSALPPSY